jgi:hypothetical protein
MMESRDDLLFQQRVQDIRFGRIAANVLPVIFAGANRPSNVRRVTFRPPTV